MTTSAQQAANERNAKLSTGPRTQEGKDRASRNSLRHGAWATRLDMVEASILREDLVEVQLLIDALVEELAPTTPLEFAQARVVAQRIVNQRRVDRLTAPLVEGQALSAAQSALFGPVRGHVDLLDNLAGVLIAIEDG